MTSDLALRRPIGRLGGLAAFAITSALLAGCGSDSSDAGGSSGPTSASDVADQAGNTSGSADSGKPAAALDVCTLVTAAEVSAAVGGTVAVSERSGGKLCDFTAEERTTLTPTIDDITESGYDQSRSGATQLLKNESHDLPGVGDKAFVASGMLSGYRAVEGAVAGGGHAVMVTITSTIKTYEQLTAMAEKILTAIGGRL